MSMSMRTIWVHYMDGLRLVGMLAKTKNGLTKIHLHCMSQFFWNPYDSKQHKKYHSSHATIPVKNKDYDCAIKIQITIAI